MGKTYFEKAKLNYINACEKYLKDMMYQAKDNHKLLKDLYYLTILFQLIDWIYIMSWNEGEVLPHDKVTAECLLKMIRTIINQNPEICIPIADIDDLLVNINLGDNYSYNSIKITTEQLENIPIYRLYHE